MFLLYSLYICIYINIPVFSRISTTLAPCKKSLFVHLRNPCPTRWKSLQLGFEFLGAMQFSMNGSVLHSLAQSFKDVTFYLKTQQYSFVQKMVEMQLTFLNVFDSFFTLSLFLSYLSLTACVNVFLYICAVYGQFVLVIYGSYAYCV